MITLKKITNDNLEDILNLSVYENQKNYVSTSAHSLAQAYVNHKTAFPFAIMDKI